MYQFPCSSPAEEGIAAGDDVGVGEYYAGSAFGQVRDDLVQAAASLLNTDLLLSGLGEPLLDPRLVLGQDLVVEALVRVSRIDPDGGGGVDKIDPKPGCTHISGLLH